MKNFGGRVSQVSRLGWLCSRHQSSVRNHVVEKTPITSQLWALRKVDSKKHLEDPNRKSELLTKTVASSRLTLVYPFDTDESLRDLYIDHIGGVSIGKLFEDLDAMAGNIAHTHCDDNDPLTPPLSLVTASADHICLAKKICLDKRLVISGALAKVHYELILSVFQMILFQVKLFGWVPAH